MGRNSLEEDTNHVLVLSEQRHLFLYFCISFYTSVLLFLSHGYILNTPRWLSWVYLQCRRHWFDFWIGRSPEKGNGNPLQYSCLGNSMYRAWRAIVHRVAKSWTWLKQLSTHTYSQRNTAESAAVLLNHIVQHCLQLAMGMWLSPHQWYVNRSDMCHFWGRGLLPP